MYDKIVEVTPASPKCGTVELDVSHIIAASKEKNTIYFEAFSWTLWPDDFDKVYNAWKE